MSVLLLKASETRIAHAHPTKESLRVISLTDTSNIHEEISQEHVHRVTYLAECELLSLGCHIGVDKIPR